MHRINNDACRAEAHDEGALIRSWAPHGFGDVLFSSRRSRVGVGAEVHGGIPLCAPWFGRGRPGIPVPRIHGIVRYQPWRLTVRDDQSAFQRAGHRGRPDGMSPSWASSTTLEWQLSDIAGQPGSENYPDDIWFHHRARFSTTLAMELEIGAGSDFVLDQAFHTYFAVDDLIGVSIEGLEGVSFTDSSTGQAGVDDEPLRPMGALNRVYRGCPTVRIADAQRVITVVPRGAANVIVWNPGQEGAAELPGFGPEEWRSMICVEVGNVIDDPVHVPANSSHVLGMEISVAAR